MALAGPAGRFGAPPRGGGRAGDRGCPEDAEEGNVVGARNKNARATCPPGTRPSLGPPARARHSATGGRSRTSRTNATASRSGKPASTRRKARGTRTGGTGTGVVASGRMRGSPRPVAPAREAARGVRKGRRSRPPSLRGHESSGLSPYVVVVAEVGRRRLASNRLTPCAPKRVAAGVNGGLARGSSRRKRRGKPRAKR